MTDLKFIMPNISKIIKKIGRTYGTFTLSQYLKIHGINSMATISGRSDGAFEFRLGLPYLFLVSCFSKKKTSPASR